MQRIYTGPNYPKLGLYTYAIYLEDESGSKFPANVAAALKANPGLERHFTNFETFSGGIPPGAPVAQAPGGAAKTSPRRNPIRRKSSSIFTIIGRK
jgi:hypothetical protein